MVEAYVTGLILAIAASTILLILHITPESWKEWVYVKLHLDNDDPYEEIDED